MKRITITIITVLMIGGYARGINRNAGTTSAQFLKIGIGARALSLGGTYLSAEGDISSIYWNPAGIATVNNVQVLFMFSDWLSQANYSNVLVGIPLYGLGTVGLMVNYLRVNEITGLDEYGFSSGETYSPYDMAVTLSWAKNFSNLIQPGLNIKSVNSMLVENVSYSAVAMDIGNQFEFAALEKIINAGVALKNLQLNSNSDYTLPVNFGAGASCTLFDNLLLALDMNLPSDDAISTSFGIEYALDVDEANLAFRFGAKSGYEGLGPSAGISIGTGISWKDLVIDFSFNAHGALGENVSMSLIYQFD
jgi:hypothetical protein